MMISKAIIYGAGGHARELHFQLQAEGASVLAFIDHFNPVLISTALPYFLVMMLAYVFLMQIGTLQSGILLAVKLSSKSFAISV